MEKRFLKMYGTYMDLCKTLSWLRWTPVGSFKCIWGQKIFYKAFPLRNSTPGRKIIFICVTGLLTHQGVSHTIHHVELRLLKFYRTLRGKQFHTYKIATQMYAKLLSHFRFKFIHFYLKQHRHWLALIESPISFFAFLFNAKRL